jgi:hypothetical protein
MMKIKKPIAGTLSIHKLAFVLFLLSTVPSAAPAAERPCPKTDKEWTQLRSSLLFTFQTNQEDGGYELPSYYKKCLIGASPRIVACMTPLVVYTEARRKLQDAETNLGRKIPIDEYSAKHREKLEPPTELLNKEIVQNMLPWNENSDRNIRANLLKWNTERKSKGLPQVEMVPYESELASLDAYATPERLLFVIPGSGKESVDKYIQFTPDGATVSSVTVAKQADGSFKSYFKDNHLQRGDEAPFLQGLSSKEKSDAFKARVHSLSKNQTHFVYPHNNVTGSEACILCHSKGGPNKIYPKKKVTPDLQATIASINERIESYGRSFSEDELDYKGLMPRFGDFTSVPEKVLNKACFDTYVDYRVKDLPPSSQGNARKTLSTKLHSAMDCTKCHDGKDQFEIYPPLSKNAQAGPKGQVLTGKMPPGNNLSEAEREMVWNCMEESYWGGRQKLGTYYTKVGNNSVVANFMSQPSCELPEENPKKHEAQNPGLPENRAHSKKP